MVYQVEVKVESHSVFPVKSCGREKRLCPSTKHWPHDQLIRFCVPVENGISEVPCGHFTNSAFGAVHVFIASMSGA